MDNPQDKPKNDVSFEGNKINSPVLNRPIILGDLTLGSPTTQTTIGANGAASALTANPVGYLTVNIGNTSYQIPYYTMA
jgi:hypothetical protein